MPLPKISPPKFTRLIFSLFVTAALLYPSPAPAHDIGKSLTKLTILSNHINGESLVCFEDLALAIPHRNALNHPFTPNELLNQPQVIANYFAEKFSVVANHEVLKFVPLGITQGENQNCNFARILFRLEGSSDLKPSTLEIHHTLFADQNPDYYGIIESVTPEGTGKTSVVLSRIGKTLIYLNRGKEIRDFLIFGMYHIAIGADHILFILLMCFTVFGNRSGRKSLNNQNLRLELYELTKLITAFTIAHSFTLFFSLLRTNIIPTKIIETVIAFSIVILGIENIFHLKKFRGWRIVYLFGLFHGMGFSGTLKELGLAKNGLLIPLASFNIGIELGQICIVLAVVLLFFLLERLKVNREKAIRVSSIFITILAIYWTIERILN